MQISAHRKHIISIAATMDFQLGSSDPDEIEYYSKIKYKALRDNTFRYMGVNVSD